MMPEKLDVAREMYSSGKHTLASIAKTLSVSRATLHRHLAAQAP
jgi:hypothetical protein